MCACGTVPLPIHQNARYQAKASTNMIDKSFSMQAAGRYEAAWKLRSTSHAALYNWGVAYSDMARVVKPIDQNQAHEYLRLSAEKYSMSLQYNPQNPQVCCKLNSFQDPWQTCYRQIDTFSPRRRPFPSGTSSAAGVLTSLLTISAQLSG